MSFHSLDRVNRKATTVILRDEKVAMMSGIVISAFLQNKFGIVMSPDPLPALVVW